MTIYYSPSLKGFYDTNVNITEPGPDFIEISYEDYIYLLNGETSEKMIGLDSNGKPALIDKPAPTGEELERLQKNKLQTSNQTAASQKSALTNRIGVINDAIEFGEATVEEVAELPVRNTQLTAWKRYAVLLGRVTAQPGWYESVDWPVQPADGMDLSTSPTGLTS